MPELRQRSQAEHQRPRQRHVHQGGGAERERRQQHVAGAAQRAGERVGEPHQDGAAEHHVRISHGIAEGRILRPEQPVHRPAEAAQQQGEGDPERQGDRQRVNHQAAHRDKVARAERARDRRRDAAAHRAGGSHLQQHQQREHQRQARERHGPEPADEPGVADRDHRLEHHQQRSRGRQAQQRRQDRRREQALDAAVGGGRGVAHRASLAGRRAGGVAFRR